MKNSKDFYSNCEKHSGVDGIVQNQEKPYCSNCGAKIDEGE